MISDTINNIIMNNTIDNDNSGVWVNEFTRASCINECMRVVPFLRAGACERVRHVCMHGCTYVLITCAFVLFCCLSWFVYLSCFDHVCVFACTQANPPAQHCQTQHIHVHVYIYIYIYIHTYVCIYIYIYIHGTTPR